MKRSMAGRVVDGHTRHKEAVADARLTGTHRLSASQLPHLASAPGVSALCSRVRLPTFRTCTSNPARHLYAVWTT